MTLAYRQHATQNLWDQYSNDFEFMISDIVSNEVRQGDPSAVQRRLEVIANLTVLETPPASHKLVQKLIDAGAVPQSSLPDAQHIAIAAVHRLEYLISWNYKHIVNETKRQRINQVCQSEGYQPVTICTPAELIEEMQMKEKLGTLIDPVLEECYCMKEKFAAQFNTPKELYDFLKTEEKKNKALGKKYRPAPPPPENSSKLNR